MDLPVLADQQELIYINSGRTQVVVLKTWQEESTIRIKGGTELGKSVLSVWLDDDDDL